MRLHLVADARNWWRWHSMRFLAVGGALQGALVAINNGGISQFIQPWIMTALADVSLACMLAAAIGRMIDQSKGKADGPDNARPDSPADGR